MFGLWKRSQGNDAKHLNSDEYERVLKRISELSSELGVCKANLEILRTDLANLRGKFNQRLRGSKHEEEQTTEATKSESDLTKDLYPEIPLG